MKSKKILLLLVCILILLFSYWLISGISQKKVSIEKNVRHVKDEYGSYFFPLTIGKFTRANQPCIPININGTPVSATLDLGFRGQLACSSEFLKHLEQKKYLGIQKMYGAWGGEYEQNLYEIEVVEIGPISFSHPILHEETCRFHEDAVLRKENDIFSIPEPSKVGWELFGNTNLFLDLKNSTIAFCDSFETLEKEGYTTSEFVKTPLLLERGLVEFEAEIAGEFLRCMLDTGATWNILNTDFKRQLPENQATPTTDHIWDCSVFRIQGKNFGPIAFHRLLIKMPIRIDAILGMEFFEEHLIFLDFSKKYAYFSGGDQKVSSKQNDRIATRVKIL